jgi:7,8-dihydropterin-6-yl-methyl-4-(beta-D-ribofuranosyl)aminobenzene 5'-phosphate synthase
MKTQIKLTILYDNNPLLNKLQTDWGFSCLIETGSSVLLFDTGDNGKILLDNMKNLSVDPKNIDAVFLSHYHHDHTGGLKEFLYANPNVKVFYPASFPLELVDLIKRMNALPAPVSDFTEIMPDLFSLGVIDGTIPEQSLAIRSQNGIIIITGCAHPGIINILQKAKNEFPYELIYLVLGGFHLHRFNEEEINNTVKSLFDMGVITVAPTHCSGEAARKLFKKEFDKNYIEVGVGIIAEIN